LKYDKRARIAEYQYYRSDEADEAERLGIDVETAALGAKLRGGGDLFHRSCAILSFACVGSRRCRGHVMDQLKIQGAGISSELFFLCPTLTFVASCALRVCLLMYPNLWEISLHRINDAVIKMGLIEFASLLDDGSQKSQIDHYIREM
jgi:hypothetical protein